MRVQKIDNSVSFARKPNSTEMQVYTSSVNRGLELLGKQVDVILHNASAPAVKSENTGIGSLFSRTTVTKLFPFLKNHGITGIQQEPNGFRKAWDNSPYALEANTKNIFMIPLEKLASAEYGYILSKETFNKIVQNNPSKEIVDYTYIRKMYDIALKEAFNNSKNSPEFLEFKASHEKEYEQSALYRILSQLHGNDDFHTWETADKTLYLHPRSKSSKARISELKEKYRDEYDYYIFQQMILEKENRKANKAAKETGIKIIGDSPVAPSMVEAWTQQDLFMEGVSLGCPPDYFSEDGQRWGFPYYKPEEIFNQDGSLGKAGKALKKKYEEYFASFPGGIRIDHIIGLIDPFIYTNASKKMTNENSGRIYSKDGSQYQKHSDEEYAALIQKIIIPAAEKFGLNKSAIICEDLGEQTQPVRNVMNKLNLSGIEVTQYDYRGAHTPAKNVIMLGSHDNTSFIEFVEDLFNFHGNHDKTARFMRKTEYLVQDTAPQGASQEAKERYLKELRTDKLKFIASSFTELFTSPAKRVQIFFTDLWGIGKTYNRPGTTQGNWALRLSEDFENDYYRAAAEGNAPNFAEIIASALRHRGLDKGQEALMNDLDKSAKIIAERA